MNIKKISTVLFAVILGIVIGVIGLKNLDKISKEPTKEYIATEKSYLAVNMNDNFIRYIRIIKGIATNEHYDVYPDGQIFKSDKEFNHQDIEFIEKELLAPYSSQYSSMAPKELNIDTDKISKDEEAYYKLNNTIVHIRIISIEGDDPIFINLSTGEKIPFDVIYGIKSEWFVITYICLTLYTEWFLA